ncbi:coiled-coil and C2 domain-containing protein [Elysia marginata]|uniref:Coiled-coil and C2 domain-containing protein n=1 Tax=Elysia marginata TaxID=1093978 RepID=A0AAV4HLS5_9GAST|nr:coiled-coil and C2 domain-containing protein [Elysia marginata]
MGFGVMPGLGDIDSMVYGDDDDDEDLEAELAALAGESSPPKKQKPKRRAPMPMADIESLAKAGMESVDEDVSDTEDPELLAELEDLQSEEEEAPEASPVKSPNLSNQKAPAPTVNQPAPTRPSPNTTLTPSSSSSSSSLSNQVAQGSQASSPVAHRAAPPAPSPKPSASPSPRPSLSPAAGSSGGMVGLLEERLNMYKMASANAKTAGDSSKQRRLDRGIKTLAGLLRQAKAGKPVNEEEIPPAVAMGASVAKSEPPVPSTSELPSSLPNEERHETPKPSSAGSSHSKDALEERRDQYRKAAVMAKKNGDMAKAGRYVKVSKQFDAVIQAIDEGKEVDLSQMPPPPPEFSGEAVQAVANPQASVPVQRVSQQAAGEDAEPDLPTVSAEAGRKSMHSRQEQQLAFLRERMSEFKQAAMQAKKNHDLELAKGYVRMMKGMEPMIEACEGGLPVDLAQMCVANAQHYQKLGDVPAAAKFQKLEQNCRRDLESLKSAYRHADPAPRFHYETRSFSMVQSNTELGDADLELTIVRGIQYNLPSGYSEKDMDTHVKFQKLEQNCRRDLESLKSAYRHADPAPRFHYETRSFSMVQSNTELGDADLELTIVRGIQYNLPSGYSEKDMDTHVKYEFAFPTEWKSSNRRLHSASGTDLTQVEYNETFRLQINRKSKGLFRFVERKGIKLEIFMKRGFFKGDKLLGTVNLKLQPLEHKCTVHDSYDLMDGRKTVGGKLEVKLRIRDPLKTKQVEEVKEKWLVIDQFIRTVGSKAPKPVK